jgi:hypothetical protein
MTLNSGEWAQVANVNWLHQALLLKSVLESEGIDVRLPDEHTVSIQPGVTTALGGIRVLVQAHELEHARTILKDVEPADPPAQEDDAH